MSAKYDYIKQPPPLSYFTSESTNQTLISDSVPCQGGTFKDGSQSVCQKCPTNSYSAERSGLCITCPKGSHVSEDHIHCGNFLWYILFKYSMYSTSLHQGQLEIWTTDFYSRLCILACTFLTHIKLFKTFSFV